MNELTKYRLSGQHAALRGCWRALADAPSERHRNAWLDGYDSVPKEMRGAAPLVGPIPNYLSVKQALPPA